MIIIIFFYTSAFTFKRARLLDNTERLERSGRQLEEGYKMCVETGAAYYIILISLTIQEDLQYAQSPSVPFLPQNERKFSAPPSS